MLGAAGAVPGTLLGIVIAYLLAALLRREVHRRGVRLRHLGAGGRGQPGDRPGAGGRRVAARAAARAAQAGGRDPGRPGHRRLRLGLARPCGRAQRPAGRRRPARQPADGGPQRAAFKSAAARPRSRRSPWPPGWRSRCWPSASRSTRVIGQTIGKLHFSVGVGEAAGRRRAALHRPRAGRRRRDPRGDRRQAGGDEHGAVRRPVLRGMGPGQPPALLLRPERGPLVHRRADRRASAGAAVPPVVLGPVVASAAGASVGQTLTFNMAKGPCGSA